MLRELPPELKLLILSAAILLVAYLGLYPSMRKITVNRMMVVDMVLTALALIVAAGLFRGSDTPFSLILFQTNWAVFSILTMAVMEIPLFIWFWRKHGIDISGSD